MPSGRLPNSIKHKFEEIIHSPSGLAKFKRIMAATKKDDTYLAYFKEAMDRSHGKAAQFLEMDLNDVTGRPTTEELNAALRSLEDHKNGNGVEAKE